MAKPPQLSSEEYRLEACCACSAANLDMTYFVPPVHVQDGLMVWRHRIWKASRARMWRRQARNQWGRSPPRKIFAPPLEKCVGHSFKVLDIVKQICATLRKLFAPPSVPSWLRAWTAVRCPSLPCIEQCRDVDSIANGHLGAWGKVTVRKNELGQPPEGSRR